MNRFAATVAGTSLMLASNVGMAQVVVVGFGGGGATPVPISPWASAVMAIVLAFLSYRMFKKRSALGLFLGVLAMTAGSAAIYTSDVDAAAWPVLSLTGSGQVSTGDLGLNLCDTSAVTVQNGLGMPATLSSIQVNGVPRVLTAVWTIYPFQAGDCQVGAQLAPSSSCLVRFTDSSNAC
jgi:hypothetical protein